MHETIVSSKDKNHQIIHFLIDEDFYCILI